MSLINGKKKPCFAVGLFIFDKETKKVMFPCTDPNQNEGKISIEFMHTTFLSKKIVDKEKISEVALETFNSYLNKRTEEFEIDKLKVLDIQNGNLMCHLVCIPYESVRILAYNRPYCMLNFKEFNKSKIKLKKKKHKSDILLNQHQISDMVSQAFETLQSENQNLQKIA